MEFLPMVWGNSVGALDLLVDYLDGGATPSTILFLNEPNYIQPLGSFIPPLDAANWLTTVKDALSDYSHIPLSGPHIALGGPPEESITAIDPNTGEMTTFTTGVSYLDAFDFYAEEGVLDSLGFHSYSRGEMEFWVDTMYERSGKPVWVKEFAYMGSTDIEDQYDYIIETLDYLEHSPKVERYAWFKADFSTQNLALALINTPRNGGGLSKIGELYVNYPAFDPDYYFPPGVRIHAESYVAHENMKIGRSDSDDGWAAFSLVSTRREGWMDFQVEVPTAGEYRLRVRITSDSFEDLGPASGDSTVADPPEGIERDVYFNVPLQAGQQTMRLLVRGLNGKVDWLEIME